MNRTAYLVASRQGIYLAGRDGVRRLAEGRFFGLACVEADVFAFRHDWDPPAGDVLSGEIVLFAWTGNELREVRTLVRGLDYNCHQLDHFEGAFFLVDTANQRIVEYDKSWSQVASHQILAPAPRQGSAHAHLNSVAVTRNAVWVMLHNGKRSLSSEIVEYDRSFRERRRLTLPCNGCHDIVPLDDGALMTCLSPLGAIASVPGEIVPIDKLWTRGLVVSDTEIAIGSSLFGKRMGRALLPGFLTLLDRDYRRTDRIFLPAAPTQIRSVELAG